MKKIVLFFPVLGFAGAVLAQSSVTIFGVLDATIAYGDGSITNRTQMTRGGMQTPRFGFHGSEDLGSGLKAGFWLEGQANTDDGTGGATNTNNQPSGASSATQGLNFARRATVSLIGGWGEVRLGRDIVPQNHNLSRGDVFGNVGVGTAVNWSAIITGSTSVRASNMASYFMPKIGGFSAQLSQWFGENSGGTAAARDGTGTGVHLGYERGAMQLGVAHARTHQATGDIKQSNIQAGYKFGIARVTGNISRDRSASLSARGGVVSTAIPFGFHTAKIGYSWYKINTNAEAKKISLGYVYSLSKRTDLYATAAYIRNSGGAAYALNGSTTGVNSSSSGYDMGIRHSF